MPNSIESFYESSLESATPPRNGHRHHDHPITSAREHPDARAEEIAVICHELRNCLATVRNTARLLRSPKVGSGAEGACALIERQIDQMSRHLQDLQSPRPRGDHGKLHFSYLDLRAIARFAADAISSDISHRGHRLTISLPEAPIWVRADGARLEQVITNMLINAAKYTPHGGSISLTVERGDDEARVRVRDSGIGIEPTHLSKVFDMFFQADTAMSRAEGGRGIGLAVVRDIIELHGGTVSALSAGRDLGAEFTCVLPDFRGNQSNR